jgi:beta-lactamase regulating signal transducer with metallopeptidase domain
MMFEYTILTTLAFHHLVLGAVLIFSLMLTSKMVKSTAETRSWLWMTAFIISTLVPFTLFSSDIEKRIVATGSGAQTVQVKQASGPVNEQPNDVTKASWHLPSEIVFNFSLLLSIGIVIWVIGSLWRSLGVLLAFVRTRRFLDSTLSPVPGLSAELDIDVFASRNDDSPMVVGLIAPKVIMPQSILNELQHDQLVAIALHERAHIQRKDNWFSLFQELIMILFWWSPVLRYLNKKIHVEREVACDLRAVVHMENSKQYAQSLIDCAKLMLNEQRDIMAMSLFSKTRELNYRVGAVLQSNKKKVPSITVIALLCALLGISSLQAAQMLSPKISVRQSAIDARFYSVLSRQVGERLLQAVVDNDVDTIKALIGSGVDINTSVVGDGTALMIAVKKRNASIVRTLIDLGADVNQASMFDGNPLIVAAQTNNIELAKILIDEGADVNGIVRRDETPLINATSRDHLEMTMLLVERGADVNLAVTTGIEDGYQVRSPLNRARTPQLREYLLSNGAIE